MRKQGAAYVEVFTVQAKCVCRDKCQLKPTFSELPFTYANTHTNRALFLLFGSQQYLFLQDFNKWWQNTSLKRCTSFVATHIPYSACFGIAWGEKNPNSSCKQEVLLSQGSHEENQDPLSQSIKPSLRHKRSVSYCSLVVFLSNRLLFWAPKKYFLQKKYTPVRG